MSSSYSVITGNQPSVVAPSNSDEERYVDYNNDDSRSNNYEPAYGDTEEDTDDASETDTRTTVRSRNGNGNGNDNGNNNANGFNSGTVKASPRPQPVAAISSSPAISSSVNEENNHELKEQMYQHKLANLKKQLDELHQLTHPEYVRKLKKLDYYYKERLCLNEVYRDYLKSCVERDYVLEVNAAKKEYEEKKIDLKENILSELEERRKMVENERFSLELTNDSTEIKPTVTRKLRRRPNDPVPVVEKRRKPTTGQLLIYLLDDKDIDSDLKTIHRACQQNGLTGAYNSNNSHQSSMLNESGGNQYVETRIEDGKLLYEKRWFHRGQQVYVEGKDMTKFAATISAIGNEVIWVKKSNDSKIKINMMHLTKGKVIIKRRAN